MAVEFWSSLSKFGLSTGFRRALARRRDERSLNEIVNGDKGLRLSLVESRDLFRLLSRPGVESHLVRLGKLWKDNRGPHPSEALNQAIGLMCVDTDFRKHLSAAKDGADLKQRAKKLHFKLGQREANALHRLLKPEPTLESVPVKLLKDFGKNPKAFAKAGAKGLRGAKPVPPALAPVLKKGAASAQDCMIIVEAAWSPPPDVCDQRMIFPKKTPKGLAIVPGF